MTRALKWDVDTGTTASESLTEVLLEREGVIIRIPMDVESATDLRDTLTNSLEFIEQWKGSAMIAAAARKYEEKVGEK